MIKTILNDFGSIRAFQHYRPLTYKSDIHRHKNQRLLKCHGALKSKNENSVQEYNELKSQFKNRIRNSGAFLSVYIALTISPKAAICSLIGSCASYIYFIWLINDIDNLNSIEQIPIKSLDKYPKGIIKNIYSVFASYKQAFKPRLLPLIFLAFGTKIYEYFNGESLNNTELISLYIGFLVYKFPLIQCIYDDLKPKYIPGMMNIMKRPKLIKNDDDFEINVDIYGRKQK